ncbi:spore germination protein KB [Paenibacillus wynnii]|nr:spore germination protein KB [Paenibacillus wynnii]
MNTIFPTVTVVLPGIIGNYAEQDAPFVIILSALVGLGIAALVGTVIRINNGAPFLDWIGEKSSSLIATVLGLLLLQFYLSTSSGILREFVNFIKDNVLLNTPVTVLTLLILLITIYMVKQGIESIARVNSIVIMPLVFFTPLYLIGLSGNLNIHRLLPLFDHNVAEFTLGSLTPISWLSEVAVLLFLAPYLKSPQKARFIGWLGLLSVSLLLMFSVITSLLVFGPDYIKLTTYPGFSTTSVLHIGKFIERMDILFISYWVLSIYLKFSIFLFATVECFKQTFRVKGSTPYIGALGLVIALECLFTWHDPAKFNAYSNEACYLVFILFNALLPLAIILLHRFRQSKSKKNGCET